MDEDASGVPHSSHMPANSFISGSSMLPGMQGMGVGMSNGMGGSMAVLGNSMSGMGGAISGMNMGGMGGLSSDMERRAEDGTDFSHFGDDSSNKGNELGLDSEPQSGTGPKPRKHFRGFQRKPEANLLLLKAVLKHQPFKHGNVGPGMFPKHTKNSGLAISTRLQVQNHGHREDRRSLTPAHTSAHLSTSDRPRSPPPHELYQNA
jgi:hypothetical protein